jgi:hypothetical protein
MLKTTIGHSNDPDAQSAIDEVIRQCQTALAGHLPQAGILLAANDYDHALLLHAIKLAWPEMALIGCTTDGEVSSTLGFQQDSLLLTLFCSDVVEIRAGVGRNLAQDPQVAAQQAVMQAGSDRPPQLCLTLPESLTTSGIAIINGLKAVLGDTFPIYGGLAGEEWKFQHTYQFYQTEVLEDALPILLFSGSGLRFSSGVASGFLPVSKPGRVTKSVGHILYEIDGKPALNFYRQHFGNLKPSPEHPLAVFDEAQQHFYLRGFSSYDPIHGTITSFADIPEQSIVQMATASREEILLGAKAAMRIALENYPGTYPEVALLFSCASRRKILGTHANEEYQLVQTCFDQPITTAGFYTYGEIAPLHQLGATQLHQDTLVTLLLGTQ